MSIFLLSILLLITLDGMTGLIQFVLKEYADISGWVTETVPDRYPQ